MLYANYQLHFCSGDAAAKNLKREFQRNSERFLFLKVHLELFSNLSFIQ